MGLLLDNFEELHDTLVFINDQSAENKENHQLVIEFSGYAAKDEKAFYEAVIRVIGSQFRNINELVKGIAENVDKIVQRWGYVSYNEMKMAHEMLTVGLK